MSTVTISSHCHAREHHRIECQCGQCSAFRCSELAPCAHCASKPPADCGPPTVRLSPSRAAKFREEAEAAGYYVVEFVGGGYWGPAIFVDQDQLVAVGRAVSGDLRTERGQGRWVVHPRV